MLVFVKSSTSEFCDIVSDGGPWPTLGRGDFGSNPSQSMQLRIAAATWQIQTRSSDSAFCRITLVLVIIALLSAGAPSVCQGSHASWKVLDFFSW